MRLISGLLAAGILGGALLVSGNTAASADDTPPPIEENYDYPGADKIFEEHGIRLHKGNGRILFVPCGDRTDVLKVSSWSKGDFCFEVTGVPGYLSMEIPEAFAIRGNENTVTATITVEGKTQSVEVRKNGWTQIGDGTDPESPPATLLELRASA